MDESVRLDSTFRPDRCLSGLAWTAICILVALRLIFLPLPISSTTTKTSFSSKAVFLLSGPDASSTNEDRVHQPTYGDLFGRRLRSVLLGEGGKWHAWIGATATGPYEPYLGDDGRQESLELGCDWVPTPPVSEQVRPRRVRGHGKLPCPLTRRGRTYGRRGLF